MFKLKSLKRITEAATAYDIKRYMDDVAKANADYEKVREESRTWLGAKPLHWLLSTNPKLAEAAKDRNLAISAAKERLRAAREGRVPEQDYNEARFEAAKAKASVATGANKTVGEENTGILHRVGRTIAEHPYLAAGTAAGLVGIAALQKRKQRLPEPGSYNRGV